MLSALAKKAAAPAARAASRSVQQLGRKRPRLFP